MATHPWALRSSSSLRSSYCPHLISLIFEFAAPLGGIGQHEHVQTGEQQQEERRQGQEAYPVGMRPQRHGDEVDDDGHRKRNGQPAVELTKPRIPVHWDLLSLAIARAR